MLYFFLKVLPAFMLLATPLLPPTLWAQALPLWSKQTELLPFQAGRAGSRPGGFSANQGSVCNAAWPQLKWRLTWDPGGPSTVLPGF